MTTIKYCVKKYALEEDHKTLVVKYLTSDFRWEPKETFCEWGYPPLLLELEDAGVLLRLLNVNLDAGENHGLETFYQLINEWEELSDDEGTYNEFGDWVKYYVRSK